MMNVCGSKKNQHVNSTSASYSEGDVDSVYMWSKKDQHVMSASRNYSEGDIERF